MLWNMSTIFILSTFYAHCAVRPLACCLHLFQRCASVRNFVNKTLQLTTFCSTQRNFNAPHEQFELLRGQTHMQKCRQTCGLVNGDCRHEYYDVKLVRCTRMRPRDQHISHL